MKRIVQFVFALIVILAIFATCGGYFIQTTTQHWFLRDISLRAELVVNGARHALAGYLDKNDHIGLERILNEITRDERILSAAACSSKHESLASTASFSEKFSCSALASKIIIADSAGEIFQETSNLSSGSVYVSVLPVKDDQGIRGYVILVHDLSYAEKRAQQTQTILFAVVFIFGVVASALTLVLARVAWRRWIQEARSALRGEIKNNRHFAPLLSDISAMAEKLVSEREIDYKDGIWNPERLKQTLQHYLQDDKVIVVANREPYIHEIKQNGEMEVVHPASGLVTALEPVLRACSGIWVAHGSGSGDKQTVDGASHIQVPPGSPVYTLRRLWMTELEEDGYYYGFSNEGLWPLCHTADTRPAFRTEDWEQYVAINRRFANAACQEAKTDDPIILVQDYHLSLVPMYIREKLPKATVITFWHIPWPTAERFGICPWRDEILNGLLGSSILGFHTHAHCNNFIDSVERFLESRTDREQSAVIQQGRPTLIRPYPISIEWPVRWLAEIPSVEVCRSEIFSKLGLDKSALIGVGVDRLDYTKGVEERLLAVEKLLEKNPNLVGKFSFIQLAAPSRVKIAKYKDLNSKVEEVVLRINNRFGNDKYHPIILLHEHHEPPVVFKYFRAANFCYVSSLHDGMNLVAKEFVASRDDNHGVLVLSQFTGASRELSEALLVNPYDIDEAASVLLAALSMSLVEQEARMKSMRALLSEFNIYRWAGRMLVDAARLRRRERLSGELTTNNTLSTLVDT